MDRTPKRLMDVLVGTTTEIKQTSATNHTKRFAYIHDIAISCVYE